MKPHLYSLAFLLAFPLAAEIAVKGLRVESEENPLGIETARPRLSWVLESPEPGQRQTAYQVLVSSSAEKLSAGQADVWNSGKVLSSQSIQVPYRGAPLRSRQRCFWKVRAWDKGGRASAYSAPASWEMGLLSPKDWKAEWIGYQAGWNGRALYFRYEVELKKPVALARAYAAGLGYHELRINGRRVGRNVLDPAVADYAKRVLYATHDVTSLLRRGENVVAAIVGNGWYGMPKLLAQIDVTYADGTTESIFTRGMRPDAPKQWRVTSGPIIANSIYDGETYDARLEKPGWDLPGAVKNPSDRVEGWVNATPVEPPGGRLVSQRIEPIRVVESRTPAKLTGPAPGVFVYDTGQNLAGWVLLKNIHGRRGERITLKYSENLNDDGTVNQENLRKAAATDGYILKGIGEESYEPRFTYHGFRYVQVEGFPGTPTLDNVQVRVVRSAVKPNGVFESSNELLNRIHRMVWWTEASNMHSVPTDCPQRDERMGWMNDLTVRLEESLYNFDLSRFYAKFLDDVSDTQAADGSITDTAPFKWGRRPADPVSASYLLLGWFLYQHYGDTAAMAKHYGGFQAWVDYLDRRSVNGVVPYGSWGDWSPPAEFSVSGSAGSGAISAETPLPLMSTGYLYYCAQILSKMAGILGKPEDEKKYGLLARKAAAAFEREFYKKETGGYGSNNQSANSFALFLGLVPEARKPKVLANLVENVERHGGRLTTGNLCTKYLLETLTGNGRVDVAYRIATQETYPSWGFMLANGATTLWERWEHLTGGRMNSHNHPMMGSVGSWFYKYLGGITPAAPGFRKIRIRPYPVAGLDWVRTEYTCPYGPIRSGWKKQGGRLEMEVAVPVNTTALVHVPGKGVVEVGSGEHRFEGILE